MLMESLGAPGIPGGTRSPWDPLESLGPAGVPGEPLEHLGSPGIPGVPRSPCYCFY